MKSSFDGLKKLQEKMHDLSDQDKQSVRLPELMPPEFMSRCSRFSSVQELFDSSGFKIESAADFAAIPEEQWDSYIRANTDYPSWMEMQKAAVADWTKRKLGLS